MEMPSVRTVILVVCLFMGEGVRLCAQGTRSPDDGSTHDALVAEIRTLRTEIHQMAAVSIRMQLFVARLQLQEQRVLLAARHLAEVQNTLAEVRSQIAGERARIEQLEQSMSRSAAQGQVQIRQAIAEAKAQIEQQERRQQELALREMELQNSVNNEQIRWTEFNDRLDALERSLPAGVFR
jgi:hypothetical protein